MGLPSLGELSNDKTALVSAIPLWGKQGQAISWFSLTEPAFPSRESGTQLINSFRTNYLVQGDILIDIGAQQITGPRTDL